MLLRKIRNRPATGSVFVPPNTVRSIEDPNESLLASDLSYEDIVDNFFGWEQHSIVCTEEVDNVSWQILESKPGKGERFSYARVRSWIDARRMRPVPVQMPNLEAV